MWRGLLFFAALINILVITLVWKHTNPIPTFREAKKSYKSIALPTQECNLFRGQWVEDLTRHPLYGENCPFIKKQWNCYKNKRPSMNHLNSWRWVPENCSLSQIRPYWFLRRMRNKRIVFVGDTVTENFMISLCCNLHAVEEAATYADWKFHKRVFFRKFNFTVDYRRDASLATYEYDEYDTKASSTHTPLVTMDVDLQQWIDANRYYDIVVFNSQHWWNRTKMPTDTLLNQNSLPGDLSFTTKTASSIKNGVKNGAFNIWLTPYPVHYHRGTEYEPGGCSFTLPLSTSELESWWFGENYLFARNVSSLLGKKLYSMTRKIELLDLTHLSEFRVDAHPAAWQGERDAYDLRNNPLALDDCIYWCLPGLPDTWVDILSVVLAHNVG